MQLNRSFTIIIQCLVLTSTAALGLNPVFSIEDEHADKNCLKTVFNEYVRPLLVSNNSNGRILVNLASSESIFYHQDYILKMLHQEFTVIVNSWVKYEKYQKIDSKVGIIVLFCTSLPEVMETIERWKLTIDIWNSYASVIVFLKDTTESYWKIRQILFIFMDSNLLNVNVISIGMKKIEVVTWSKYTGGGKYTRHLQVIAECILETSHYRVTYHELETNIDALDVQHNRPLKVISLDQSPYSFFNKEIGTYAGIEVELLKVIAVKMQFELNFIEVPNNSIENIKEFIRNG